MKSLIGHNNPPKDRKANWKSVSLNIWVYKELDEIRQRLIDQRNCFLLLEGKPPIGKDQISIPYVIELLSNEKTSMNQMFDVQDNGRNIWEQTAKKLLRTYNSKKGLKKRNAK